MRIYDIIKKKRDGFSLSDEEINFFINKMVSGDVPDYQTSALLMAIYLNGMTTEETVSLTMAMAKSGDMIDLSAIDGVTCDKHSTGGVGDKTTLIVAPVVAAQGGKVAKISGRGLGHTGGTIDKLESIPGFKTSLEPQKFIECVNRIGLCVIGQSKNLAQADKILYALRDVTATIESIPLIASSIMSKKLAAGSSVIVLDVKYGSGSFMKTKEESEKLARKMVDIGNMAGRRTSAVITNMDTPLGRAVGNALEVEEAVAVLRGKEGGDLWEVCRALSANMLIHVTGKPYDECLEMADTARRDGSAFEKLCEMVSFQGGDAKALENTELLPKAKYSFDVLSDQEGCIEKMDAEKIGVVSVILGAGRTKKDDLIDFGAGIILHKKTGDFVGKGEKLATLYTDRKEIIDTASNAFKNAVKTGNEKPLPEKAVYKMIR